MAFTMVSLSLVVLTGFVGQISLAQAAFAGSAAFVLANIGRSAGFPFPVSLLVAAGVATVAGVAVGLPALRIRGAQLAVVTLAGAIATEHLVFRNPELVSSGGEYIAGPELAGIDLAVRRGADISRLAFGVLALIVLALLTVAVGNLLRSDTGRAFLAVRSNERAAAASGIRVAGVKLLGFAISSFIAGIGGAFIGYSRGQLTADSFGVFASVSFLAFAYLGGITSISGAFVAGVFAPLGIVYTISVRNPTAGRGYLLTSGVTLIVAAIASPEGIAGRVRQVRGWLLRSAGRVWNHDRRPVPSAR
jgi:branched-chain amino acid transport system permease protein